ncbi:hypothetical protein PICMEDRAFT_74620 [Pichia membranifaciens NRRL Y-2026]|uniref:Trafficking protein particle complex II-specific subunit 65 IgD3 domain-containing protein n=1 Tax=Pichia membranifaciens NRRL Y-2026 TaxID=763406 RepID=A0A1E3NE31_9ASCO|nr:hypothetical protein PICMEDRAFT_74620 [Pichia membranifaciens NRRL Y-2026]ODQ44374.1 hypothetical protein PICMEDRAFT_74620 [Pichia membranifaciens NRRL Y-2026]
MSSGLMRIYAPDSPISAPCLQNNGADDANDCVRLLELLESTAQKPIAYFDENVEVFIVVPLGKNVQGVLSVDVVYEMDKSGSQGNKRQRQSSTHILEKAEYSDNGCQIWKFKFSVVPGRNLTNIELIAVYEREILRNNDLLKPFEEVNLIQIAGVDLLNDNCIATPDIDAGDDIKTLDSTTTYNSERNSNTLRASISINIASLYKMALKSYKTEKTLAWLDLSSSKTVDDMMTSLQINSIGVDCINCDIISCTPMKYPIELTKNSVLTIAYHVSHDDETSIKPLSVVINAIVDGHKHITTKWTSNLDLSNHSLPSNHSNPNLGTLNNGSKRFQQQSLLPPVKLAKLRSYSNLVSNPSMPKLQPLRSASVNSVTTGSISTPPLRGTSTVSGNSGLGGKRYSSMRLKSGSNLSLSQLWSGNSSQSFQRGLVITVSGPTRVKLGEKFRWKIQLLNKSSEKMDLILYVQNSIKKEYEKTVPPIPIQSSNKQDIVPLFTNNQLVRSFYYKFNRAGLVSLTNNLRVSLEYGNLYECELELISVERGMFNIYDFKVLDIASGDIFECNRLLDVMVV